MRTSMVRWELVDTNLVLMVSNGADGINGTDGQDGTSILINVVNSTASV